MLTFASTRCKFVLRAEHTVRSTFQARHLSKLRSRHQVNSFSQNVFVKELLPSRPWRNRRLPQAEARPSETPLPLSFMVATLSGLCLLAVGSVALPSKFSGNDHEEVWWGPRGPFSCKRAIAIGPMAACIGSGLVATLIAVRFPHRVRSLTLNSHIHDLLALPMSILLAFRFQGSFDRWLQSYRELEQVTGNLNTLACMCLALDSKHATIEHFKITLTFLGLLDAWCVHAAELLTAGEEPHPVNAAHEWPPPLEEVKVYWGAAKLESCVAEMIATIRRGQKQKVFTSEFASEMVSLIANMQEHFCACLTVNDCKTPAPFVVHMRTFLFFFAFSHPFVLLGKVGAGLILPAQVGVSFSLLGIEFVAREMEQPFGNDESDIPVQILLQKARTNIRAYHKDYLSVYFQHTGSYVHRDSERQSLKDYFLHRGGEEKLLRENSR